MMRLLLRVFAIIGGEGRVNSNELFDYFVHSIQYK